MKYILIDQDGALHREEAAEALAVLEQVGPEGWNRVQLTRTLAAWVNNVSLMSDAYRRNVTGGLVLVALGAARIPYAGPIVITGWDQALTCTDEIEAIGLTPLQDATITAVHRLVEEANGGVYAGDVSEEWVSALLAEVQGLGDMIRSGEVPGWDVRTL